MSCYRDALFDFHFIRFDHKREIWFHKIGFYKPSAVFVENEDNRVELKYGREPITYSISNEFTFSKY